MASASMHGLAYRALARDMPETALHVASRRPTTQPSAAALTRAVMWIREVLQGVVNYPRINGMQGVRGSNPLSSTTGQRADSASAVPGSPAPGSRLAATAVAQADPSPTRASHRRCWPASSRGLTFQMRSPGAGKRSGGFEASASGPGGRPRSDVVRTQHGPAPRPGLARVQSACRRLRCSRSSPVRERIGRQGMA
jgi:hypothetical protein